MKYRGWTGNQIENRFSHWIWRQYASSVWDDIRIDRVLPYEESRDPEDERHVHPLQLAGVGSEVYGAVLNGRRAIGIELKPSYYRQAVKNMEQCKPESETVDLFHETDK